MPSIRTEIEHRKRSDSLQRSANKDADDTAKNLKEFLLSPPVETTPILSPETARSTGADSGTGVRDSIVFPFGIAGEPPFLYALPLFEDLFDRPERGKGENAEQRREEHLPAKKRPHDTGNSQHEKNPPAAGSEVIFALDHHGVEKSDDQERTDSDDQSGQIISFQKFHGAICFRA